MKLRKQNKKVYVAISGGVDSSVAALLLKKQGYDVTGVFMKYWMDPNDALNGRENQCCSLDARRDAMRVCAHLGIPFKTFDFQKEFKRAVVNDFIRQYKNGLTPNPCVTCNKEIKLGLFIKKSLKDGADFVATGHYARRRELKTKNLKLKIYALVAAHDKKKDQSYFLYNLKQDQLAHTLFPLGNLSKDEVRVIALRAGLPVATKKDSQEVCFVNKGGLKEFLGKRIKTREGDIVLENGEVLGRHSGAQFYTNGQRVPVGGTGPYYVANKDLKKNQLVVAKNGNQALMLKEIIVQNINWVIAKKPKFPINVKVRTRYGADLAGAVLKVKSSNVQVFFRNAQKAITPGQSAVFYKDREIIGGGVIV